MSDVRTRPEVVKPQQELRFTVSSPLGDEALIGFERMGTKRLAEHLPKKLYTFAMKRFFIEPSGASGLDVVAFNHIRLLIKELGANGAQKLELAPWAMPIKSGGPEKRLAGVGLRALLDPLYAEDILTPLFGANPDVLDAYLEPPGGGSPYIPIRYEIGATVEDTIEAYERMEVALEHGISVSEMRFVGSYPKSERLRDEFPQYPPVERTFDLIDSLLDETPLAVVRDIKSLH